MMFRRILTSIVPMSAEFKKLLREGKFNTARYLNRRSYCTGDGELMWTTRDLLFDMRKPKLRKEPNGMWTCTIDVKSGRGYGETPQEAWINWADMQSDPMIRGQANLLRMEFLFGQADAMFRQADTIFTEP